MKILMLVNWKVEYCDRIPKGKQPPDYYVRGADYWFYQYFKKKVSVDVVDVRTFPWLERFEKEKLRFYMIQTLKVLFKLNRYDLIVSHGMQSGAALSLVRRLWKTKAKHIVFDIGAFNSAAEGGAALKLMQFASKSLDGVIYHTESQIEYYQKFFPWIVKKSVYIPFGTDTEFFAETPKKRNSAAGGDLQEKLPPQEKYILCIGYAKRDWDTLCKAFDRISDKYDVTLRLIGKPDYRSDNRKVECMGFISIDELIEQIRNSLFGVVPLEYFNYSFGQMTLLQQMALGKAVIAADVPSMRGYVREGETALVYPSKDDTRLAEEMERLLNEEPLRLKLGEQAAEAIRETYHEAAMAERIEDFYLRIMKG